jgi:hypothetical protein
MNRTCARGLGTDVRKCYLQAKQPPARACAPLIAPVREFLARNPIADLPSGAITFSSPISRGRRGFSSSFVSAMRRCPPPSASAAGRLRRPRRPRGRYPRRLLLRRLCEPREALLAAVEGQLALVSHAWPEGAQIKVRMGLHTGYAEAAADATPARPFTVLLGSAPPATVGRSSSDRRCRRCPKTRRIRDRRSRRPAQKCTVVLNAR